jgi:phosphate acyltransferase
MAKKNPKAEAAKPEAATVTVAVDAMGGDHAPDEIVHGIAALSLDTPHIQTILVGDADRIGKLLDEVKHNPERIALENASQVIAMDEKPGEAIAAKPDASILVAARIVASGGADALVSAGNTGAGILACAKNFKLVPGIRRAALAAVYPTELRRGEKDDPFSLMLDVGATVEATADDLVSFGIMGSAYSRAISKNPRPKVALLSNGTEEMKGPRAVVEANRRLRSQPGIQFIGNVEGVDLPRGTADVVVCDGFTGNVVLKMLEGVSETVMNLARYAYKSSLRWRAGLAMLSSGIKRLKEVTDWQEYGGAPVLGFDHLFLKAHGRSKARAMTNACKVAAKAVNSNFVKTIADGLASTPGQAASVEAQADIPS